MWQRRRVGTAWLLGVVMLGAAPVAPAVAAVGDPPAVAADGWLELDAGPAGEVHQLAPGGSADWPMEVEVHGEPATSLEVGLRPEPAATEVLREFLSVELQACSQPWDGHFCAQGQRVVMPRTSLTSAEGMRVDLMDPGSPETTKAHVLLTATLAADVPREVQGSRTRIVVGVHGSGDVPANPAGPPSGVLADTGFRLGGFAVLGFLAVAAGFGLARLRGPAGCANAGGKT
ncbi:hypothetical protein QF015_003208 [Paenarthrobacter sp. TE4293]|uniref:hypothetical protein n=1 Tax=Paenarthrobacter sp. TE4293 TaxID=3381695 RepID=UPI003D22E017